MQPTVIGLANDTMLCMNEETFGPVAPVAKFKTVEEVKLNVQTIRHTV